MLGESQRAAEINILRRGLDVGTVAQIEMRGPPPDQVLQPESTAKRQRHRGAQNQPADDGPRASASFLMPNFTGQALGGVTLVLQDAGFRLGSVSMAPPATSPVAPPQIRRSQHRQPTSPAPPQQPTPASVIVSQNPAPGAKIVIGSAVNFEVR